MTACLALPKIDLVIPDIFLPNPDFQIQIEFGGEIDFCCKFVIPNADAINAIIDVAIKALMPTLNPAILAPYILTLNQAIQLGLSVIDQIQIPECPLEEVEALVS